MLCYICSMLNMLVITYRTGLSRTPPLHGRLLVHIYL